jgi:hypothetical protein
MLQPTLRPSSICDIGMIVERASAGCLSIFWRATCRDYLVERRALCQHIEQEHPASRQSGGGTSEGTLKQCYRLCELAAKRATPSGRASRVLESASAGLQPIG